MKNTALSTDLSTSDGKNLSKWDEAIAEAKRQIAALKKSVRSFEHFRDSGVRFPEPKKGRGRKAKQSEAKA